MDENVINTEIQSKELVWQFYIILCCLTTVAFISNKLSIFYNISEIMPISKLKFDPKSIFCWWAFRLPPHKQASTTSKFPIIFFVSFMCCTKTNVNYFSSGVIMGIKQILISTPISHLSIGFVCVYEILLQAIHNFHKIYVRRNPEIISTIINGNLIYFPPY